MANEMLEVLKRFFFGMSSDVPAFKSAFLQVTLHF